MVCGLKATYHVGLSGLSLKARTERRDRTELNCTDMFQFCSMFKLFLSLSLLEKLL